MTQQALHFQPRFLAAHAAGSEPIPQLDELDLTAASDVARRYSLIRARLDKSVSSPDPTTPLESDPWREVAQLFGSIAESLTIAIGCEVEIEMHRRARNNESLPAQMIVGERFFAEAEALRVVELGHRAMNLALKAFALRHDWRAKVMARKKYAPYVERPFSQESQHWASLNEGAAEVLRQLCADVGHPSAEQMAAALKHLEASGEWTKVRDQRGQDFHRRRLESSTSAGVDEGSSGSENMRDGNGNVIGVRQKQEPREYRAAAGMEVEVAEISREALRRLVEALDELADGFLACIEPLSSGSYSWSHETSTFRHHIGQWTEEICSCCSFDHETR